MASESLLWAPGAGWRYSDLAFDTLADVIAKASGQSFEAYVKTNIFEPVGMGSSSFIYPEIDPALRTSGHVDNPARVSSVYPYNRRHAGSSTLNSNVIDMTRWMLVNLNRGELDGRRILQSASYEALWVPTVRITPEERSPPIHIGLSWWMSEFAGRRAIYHAGGDVGFRSFVLLVPADGIGIALTSNWQETDRETLVKEILDIVLASSPVSTPGAAKSAGTR
jgi:CubicO group peptidase (beta-lactamase class C family)